MAPEPPATDSLALAVVAASTAPMVLLDAKLNVIAASASFHRIFELDPASSTGKPIFDLGAGEWDVRQLRSLLQATVSGAAEIEDYQFDLVRPGQLTRQLVLNAEKLAYPGGGVPSVLLSVTDTTYTRIAAKLKSDLVRDKAILLQELQHRVANSLQIIAAILMQSARGVASEETRRHLQDAHSRVMSVAAIQQQLSSSSLEQVELRSYFTQLCDSLAASMIQDHGQLSIVVEADEAKVDPEVSISLGLIATELVINALKHAFPGNRAGKIVVGFHTRGPNWTLSVADDGVGMAVAGGEPKPGLGTTIVNALAKELKANVQLADQHPGVKVSVGHSQLAMVEAETPAA